ncbi:MAG: hypothetical protein ACFFDC_07805 [Promethearchaeota archaeon]
MDRKDPPRFEYTNKEHPNSNESNEKSSDQDEEKLPSSDFWMSRGNMGEKINILIGLNLVLINLVSSFMLTKDDPIPGDLVKSLIKTQEFLNKMVMQPEKGLEILENIEIVYSKVATLMEGVTNSTMSTIALEKKPQDVPENVFGLFQRNAVYLDKWGIIESIENLIASYSNLSHIGFPNFYFTASKELHRYELTQDPVSNQYDIIQIPSFQLRNLVSKLLREAPAARLLQNLRKMFPAEEDSALTSIEQDEIHNIVELYYKNISEYFSGTRSLQDSLRISSGILKNYNLGTGDLESRIPNVSFNITKEINLELQNTENILKQYILSETIILIHRLNDSLLQSERFVLFLRHLK